MANNTVAELKEYFSSVEIPETVTMQAVVWKNVPEHVKNYFDRIDTQAAGMYTTEPLIIRLLQLKDIIEGKNV